MGEIFRFKNLKFKIWPKDHEPPHVHVHGPNAHAKVNVETLEIMKSSGFSEKSLKVIQQQNFKRRIKVKKMWSNEVPGYRVIAQGNRI